jgi:copper chaperone
MLTFQVHDMSCGHCVRAIKTAVRELDARAAVDVDLARHLVRVQSSRLDAPLVREALARAGYPAVVSGAFEAPPSESAACCGCVSARCGCAG